MIPVDSNADALEQKYKDLSGLLSNIETQYQCTYLLRILEMTSVMFIPAR